MDIVAGIRALGYELGVKRGLLVPTPQPLVTVVMLPAKCAKPAAKAVRKAPKPTATRRSKR